MPDGDRIYAGLSQAYEKPYEQVCQWRHSCEEIADNLLDALRCDLKRFGREPCALLLETAEQLTQLPVGTLLEADIDWLLESRKIERAARRIGGHARGMALALYACKCRLWALQRGESARDYQQVLISAYLERVYVAQFEERAPVAKHFDGIDDTIIRERMMALRSFVLDQLNALFGRQIRNSGDVSRLRRPARSGAAVTPDTDLLA